MVVKLDTTQKYWEENIMENRSKNILWLLLCIFIELILWKR